ncbi:putative extracellular solute-binding protein [Salipiger mucosus DSM 16094]|uniref:Putative extracellular solute-binding protein n=1 Tax=Salipiger mucosus DSM 16094 TaxID=1123237 RepID=S9Q5Z2_9RHOB|nr:putative extracellular solute-binding protein [Salipiger mucosus DSM 16094]
MLAIPAGAQTITLASTVPDEGINTVMVETLSSELEERLPDANLDIFLDGTLGGERELIDLVRIGETQIHMGVIHASEYFPELDATLVPYLFPDYGSVQAFLGSETGDRLKAALEERGNAKFLGTYYQGSRWATSNTAFRTLEDLESIKIRMPEIPLWIDIWSGLGAITTPMPSPEVFSALQTGVIDAQENMLSNIWGRNIYEVQDYIVATQHQQSYVTVMANLDFWDSLTGEQQEALQAAIDAATAAATDAAVEENEEILQKIEDAGLEYVEPAPEFREKAMPVIREAASGILEEGIYEAAVKVIEEHQPSKSGSSTE